MGVKLGAGEAMVGGGEGVILAAMKQEVRSWGLEKEHPGTCPVLIRALGRSRKVSRKASPLYKGSIEPLPVTIQLTSTASQHEAREYPRRGLKHFLSKTLHWLTYV